MAKLYEKRIWRNDQTKLSAKNMNHIEDGLEALADKIDIIEENVDGIGEEKQAKLVSGENIKTINGKNVLGAGDLAIEGHSHPNLELLNTVTAAFTPELKRSYDEKSIVDVSLTGDSYDVVQYITINGREYKLAGGSSIADYFERSGISLDEAKAPGVYKIDNAYKNPTGTSANGVLETNLLQDGVIEQKWFSTTNSAIRILDPRDEGLAFYVNGAKAEQGVVRLPAGGTYMLQGDLVGCVVIGAESDVPNNRTKVILNGVNIQNRSGDVCLSYAPSAGKMIVEVEANTLNYMVVEPESARGDDDPGALHSNNNLALTGVGYLTILNNKGHGVKGSELVISGDVHMHLSTNHDAIHGGKLLKITGGYFEVVRANDAFSASSGKNNDGKMLILGGTYKIDACNEAAFEGKSANGVKRIVNANITLGEGVTQFVQARSAASADYRFKIDNMSVIVINESTTEIPEFNNFAEMFGAPRILFEEINQVGESEDIILAPTVDTTYLMLGNFTGRRIITRPAPGVKIDVTMRDVWYEGADGFNETKPFWQHEGDKRLKLSIDDGKLVHINKQAGDIVNSAKNFQVKGKGDMMLTAANGTAIKAPGYTVLGGDGLRLVSGSNVGVETNSLRLGEDPDDVDEKFAEHSNKRGISDTVAWLCGNIQDVIISAEDSASTYENQIIATQYMTGIAAIGTIAVADESTKVVAMAGQVLQSEGMPYDNSALVYADSALPHTGVIRDYNIPVEAKESIPELDDSVGAWTVYSGDGYSKAYIEEHFVPKAAYESLLARVEDLERRLPPATTEPELSENGNLTLHNTEVADGDLNLGNLASLTDAGSLIL